MPSTTARYNAAISLPGAERSRLFRRHSRRKDPQGHARPRLAHREHESGAFRFGKFEDQYEDALKGGSSRDG